IETILRIMSISGPHADEQLRRLEAESPLAAVRRAELVRQEDPLLAADILVDATDRFDDPRLLLLAMDAYIEAGEWERAEALASHALADLGSLWPGRVSLLRRLVEIEVELQDWPKVIAAC